MGLQVFEQAGEGGFKGVVILPVREIWDEVLASAHLVFVPSFGRFMRRCSRGLCGPFIPREIRIFRRGLGIFGFVLCRFGHSAGLAGKRSNGEEM
jgi:hypothetical protein